MSLILRVTHPTPTLVSVQFVQRSDAGDAIIGYAMPRRDDWDAPAWQHIRSGCTVEDATA